VRLQANNVLATAKQFVILNAISMKTYSEEQFLKWAKARGVVPDQRFHGSIHLTFDSGCDLSRFWCVPSEPRARPYFLAAILDTMSRWQSCRAWRYMGRWPDRACPRCEWEWVEYEILKGIGMPMGTDDIVEFKRNERARLLPLMFSTTVFGWCTTQDLYVVPNHAQNLVKLDHHGVVWVFFRNPEDVRPFVKKMREAKYPLPKTVPDWTFIIPDWMKGAKDQVETKRRRKKD
jgi:hypothetical protein